MPEQSHTLDVERVSTLINGFKVALNCTPQHMELEERARLALGGLPAWFAREIADAAKVLVTLAEVRAEENTGA